MMMKETIVTLSIILLAAIFQFEVTVLMSERRCCICVGCGQNFSDLSSLRRHASHSSLPDCGDAARQHLVGDSRIQWAPDHRAVAQNLEAQFEQAAEVFDGQFSS